MVLAKFRQHYPQGSLVSELVDIDRGTYIVRVSVQIENIVLATGLAAADRVETAEDAARARAIAALVLDSNSIKVEVDSTPTTKTKTSDKIVNSSPAIAPPAKSLPVEQSIQSIDPDAPENNHIVSLASSPTEEPIQPRDSPEQLEVTPSVSQPEPQLFSEPQAETKIIPEQSIQVPEQSLNASSNLFEGTKNVETTVEELLSEGAVASSSIEDAHQLSDTENVEEINFNEIKHKTDLEIKRLNWTKEDGREFLKSRYGRRSRLQLTDQQLKEFLQYLENQPTPS